VSLAEFELQELRNCTSANYTDLSGTSESYNQNTSTDGVDLSSTKSHEGQSEGSTEGRDIMSLEMFKSHPSGILKTTYEMRRFPTVEVKKTTHPFLRESVTSC
jgi:hypothetical protein